jgi:uncharacterized protein YifE (UPF0438 family)
MEELDFDEWIKTYQPVKPKYFAKFHHEDGSIVGIYPETALEDKSNVIEIDDETAMLVYEGKLQLSSCFIDIDSGSFQIAEVKVLNKIDDVLHRIIDRQWSRNDEEEDLFVTVYPEEKTITIELSEKYNGTRSSTKKSKRKIHWDGSTIMTFLITDYNDPNIIFDVIKIKIDDLINNTVTMKVKDIPEKFSIYTKRLFPRYILEVK